MWAVGGTGSARVLHWEGSSWDLVDATGLGAPLNGVWTAPGEDVWIAGTFGVVGRRVGEAWELAGPPPSTESFHAAWKHCDEMLFVGGNLFATSGHYGTIVRHGPPIDPIDEVTECR